MPAVCRNTPHGSRGPLTPSTYLCNIREVLERMSEIRNYRKGINQFAKSPYKSPPKKSRLSNHDHSFEPDEQTSKSHSADKRTRAHTCLFCYKEFKSPLGLQIHNQKHVGVTQWYMCYHCPATFDRKDRIVSHVKKHDFRSSYHCHICNASFSTRSQSIAHDRVHEKKKKFVCRVCGAKFRTEIIYLRHAIAHRNDKQHVCRICLKSEVSGAALLMHRNTHNVPKVLEVRPESEDDDGEYQIEVEEIEIEASESEAEPMESEAEPMESEVAAVEPKNNELIAEPVSIVE